MKTSQIKMGALLSYLIVGINIVLGLIYTPWMVNVIGQSNYGLYALSASVIALFVMDFGIGSAVSRFLSMYYAKKEYYKANIFLGTVYKAYLILATIIGIALFVFYFLLDNVYVSLSLEEMETFKSLYIVCAVYSVFSIPFLGQNNILLSNEKFVALKLCTLFNKLFTVGLTIVALLLGYGVFAIVLVNAVSNIIFIVVKIILIRKLTPARANFFVSEKELIKEFVSFSGWVTVSQLCSRSNFTLMPSVLGIMSGSAEIAFFSLASTLEGYIWNISDALGGLFLPRISQLLLKETSVKEITDLMIKVGRIQVYIIGAICICFFCMGNAFVDLWLGESYETVYYCTCIIISPSLISVPQQIADTTMTASNKVKYVAYANIVLAVTTIIIGFPLASFFGAIGASVAIAIGFLCNRLILNIMYIKILKLEIGRYFNSVYRTWIIPALISAVFIIVLQQFLPIKNWIMFTVLGASFLSVYIIFFFLLTRTKKICYYCLL